MKLAAALDINLLRSVHEDIRYRSIGQQRLERTKSKQFVQYLDDDLLSFHGGKRGALPMQHIPNDHPNPLARNSLAQAIQAFQVDLFQQLCVEL